MKDIFRKTLFEHNILVSEQTEKSEDAFAVCYALAQLFGIRITKGAALLQQEMIAFAGQQLGQNVPEPFYRGFPESVRKLSPEELLFDQIVHYTKTYGFGRFDEPGHSIMEDFVEKTAFAEKTEVKDFEVLALPEAEAKLEEYAKNMLLGSRPLSEAQFDFLKAYIVEYDYEVSACASKNTAIRLLLDLRDPAYTRFLVMSDVPKLVDEMNVRQYENDNVRKLNLKNQDRKLITAVINELFHAGSCDLRNCYEKKAIWSGLLHHIHYQPADDIAAHFAACMRGKENLSVYAEFERAMAARDIREAVSALKSGKGSGAVLRHLNYILSRCESDEDVDYVLDQLSTSNGIILMQLLMQYGVPAEKGAGRAFTFVRHNKTVVHMETEEEVQRRQSVIPEHTAARVSALIRDNLRKLYAGRLGKVYIDPDMKRIAVPIQMSASSGGWGVLPRGSRLHIGESKKIRGFTYWEKVNDIDLSVIGIRGNGSQVEFSWRTMAARISRAITYSGDQTSGYHGGSEYFDIDVEMVRKKYPEIEYLVFCNNVFSRIPFSRCICRAGYMLRDQQNSGEVFEPKTVKTSFTVDCESTFAYLFAIDLAANDFIWLNTVREGSEIVAGATTLVFLTKYFNITSVMNVYELFTMLATEIVETPEEAEVIVSDKFRQVSQGAEVIRSSDVERIMALMN